MAYNREWDKGKDSWDDAYSWAPQDARGHVREREEDYYADGKRRKFNSGVSGSAWPNARAPVHYFQGYDGAHNYEDNAYNSSYNRQQQHDWTQDYGQDDRSRGGAGGFAKKRLVPSEPSPHVIFLGLDPDFTEADVCRLPCSLPHCIPETEVTSYPASGIPRF